MNRKEQKQITGAVEKIRKFRDDFYRDYMKHHKIFNIHQFTAEFLKRPFARTK
jgi:hypothetical protein